MKMNKPSHVVFHVAYRDLLHRIVLCQRGGHLRSDVASADDDAALRRPRLYRAEEVIEVGDVAKVIQTTRVLGNVNSHLAGSDGARTCSDHAGLAVLEFLPSRKLDLLRTRVDGHDACAELGCRKPVRLVPLAVLLVLALTSTGGEVGDWEPAPITRVASWRTQ